MLSTPTGMSDDRPKEKYYLCLSVTIYLSLIYFSLPFCIYTGFYLCIIHFAGIVGLVLAKWKSGKKYECAVNKSEV